MPTFHHGKDTVFLLTSASNASNSGTIPALNTAKLTDSAPAGEDISSYVDQCDLQEMVELGETTAFGDDYKNYVVGISDSSFSLGGPWNGAIDAHLRGGTNAGDWLRRRRFQYWPQGKTGTNGATGEVYYSGECVLRTVGRTNNVSDMASWSGDCQVTGTVTRTVV